MRRLPRGLAAVAALLLAAPGCDSVTPVAPADAILTITVNPTRIKSDGEATITVLARKVDGFPVNPGTEITFSTSLGRLDPEVAFTDDQGRAVTTLFGNGEVGMATVTAVSGSIEITAETAIQIGSAPNSLILEVTPPEVNIQRVDRSREFKLRASVVDDLGEPLAGTTVRFEADIGKLDSKGEPIETNANGVARDVLTVKKDELENAGSSFFVTAVVTGGDEEGFIEIFAEEEVFIFGFAFDVFLETGQSSIPVGGGDIQLIATVLDDLGDPLEGASVQFESSAGTVASRGGVIKTDANGQAFDVFTISEQDLSAIVGNTVTVTARVLGADDAFLQDTVTLTVQGRPPIAGFTVVVECTEATFTNTSSPPATADVPVEYLWDFGDGTMVALNDDSLPVVHDYSAAGPFPRTFTVSLTATNIFGDDTAVNPVAVNPNPGPAFTATPSAGRVVAFDASGTQAQGTVTYEWDFDNNGVFDASEVDDPMITFTYAGTGTRTATLRVTACTGLPSEAQATTSVTFQVLP